MELRPGRAGALIDSPDGVVLTGAPPRATVSIEAHLELAGLSWSCAGEYTADEDGTVDTTRNASRGGTYQGVDPFGLFWSSDLPRRPDLFSVHPLNVMLRATSDDLVGDASYSRLLIGEGVTDVVVEEEGGVVGRLFLPAGEGARAVVVLSGSEGGVAWPLFGALLASHGAPTLCLAHFQHPGTPDDLKDIDVELVGRACDWVRGQARVGDLVPAVIGISRGGELGLLAAALMPERVGPVASIVGSGVPWGDVHQTAYRFRGEPVPQLDDEEDESFACLDDAELVAAAEIPVERATGPVLLLSGEEDGFLPSTRLSRIAEDRARREGAGDKVLHVAYSDAGHSVGVPPGFPMPSKIELDEISLRPGGSRAGNQAARLDAWRRLRDLVGATR